MDNIVGRESKGSEEDFTSTMKLTENLQLRNVLPYIGRNYFVLEVFPVILSKVKAIVSEIHEDAVAVIEKIIFTIESIS